MGYLDCLADLDITDTEAELRATTRFYSLPLLMERELISFDDLTRCIKDALRAEIKISLTEGATPITSAEMLRIFEDMFSLLLAGETQLEDKDLSLIDADEVWYTLLCLHDWYDCRLRTFGG
jgi:hypothetical protein|tara:strand:- start:517 stop:882 length:366 start_codon:yes stop_codon:yes gene_type:complete